jgi:tetratricopeptide (TPR) repeat protein
MKRPLNVTALVLLALLAAPAAAEPALIPRPYDGVDALANTDAEHMRWERCLRLKFDAAIRAEACAHIIHDGESDYSDLWVAWGDAAMESGDRRAAIAAYGGAIKLLPGEREPLERRALAYAEDGQYEPALADLHAAMAIRGPAAEIYNVSCWLHAVARRDMQQGLADCQAALKKNVADADALDTRGFLFFRAGQMDDAKTSYDAALALNPKLASALYVRGVIEQRNGGSGSADIAAALALDPGLAKRYGRFEIAPPP